MKIEGRISILVGTDSTTIQIKDHNASTRFLEITLSPDQLCACLSRQADVICELEVRGLERVGKKHENKTFEFKKPSGIKTHGNSREEVDILHAAAIEALKESNMNDWIPDKYFGSQNTFFRKENEDWARVTIRRYV